MQTYSTVLIMLLLIACAPPKPKIPNNLLDQHLMSDIIAEMHLADAIASKDDVVNKDSINQRAVNYREFIYTKYAVTHTQFNASFDFYKQNPILMDSVYAEVVNKLSSKEMEYRGK